MPNKYQNSFNFYDIKSDESFDASKLTIIDHFKTLKQRKGYTCGPCCVKMILQFFELESPSEERLELALKTRKIGGTEIKDIVAYFKEKYAGELNVVSGLDYPKDENGKCFADYYSFKSFVKKNLQKGNPILVENVDFGGHYKIIIGLDDQAGINNDVLIFADPDDLTDGKNDGYCVFSAENFFKMWFDDHCLDKKTRLQPFCVVSKRGEKNV